MSESVRLAREPGDYRRLGITHTIAPYEDGLRTNPHTSGTYEWWYFDAHLDDGAKLVVTFNTKNGADPAGGLDPLIQIDIDLPDGTALSRRMTFDPSEFSASTERCDVRIGGNRFTGDLHRYRIVAQLDDLEIDVTLVGTTEPWRPETGHIFYGDGDEHYFAWLPSIPHGTVEASYRAGAVTGTTTGHGYHDHNWGDIPLMKVVHDWYWGRGAAGDYTFITSHIVSTEKYGYAPIDPFMLAKNGKVIADDDRRVTFAKSRITTDDFTGKPVADLHSFHYRDDAKEYTVAYTREKTILRTRFLDRINGLRKFLARLTGFNGAYLRFSGTVEVTDAASAEPPTKDAAIWELMYFGRPLGGDS